MKHGKKPTVKQCELIAGFKHKSKYLNPDNWLVVKNLPDKLVIRHRERRTLLTIPKGGKTGNDTNKRAVYCRNAKAVSLQEA